MERAEALLSAGVFSEDLHANIITQLVQALANMERNYYDQHASKIQALWKGYYTRKHIHNFYARKAYLKSVMEKNEIMKLIPMRDE